MIILIFKKNSFHTFLNKKNFEIEKITDLLYVFIYMYILIKYYML